MRFLAVSTISLLIVVTFAFAVPIEDSWAEASSTGHGLKWDKPLEPGQYTDGWLTTPLDYAEPSVASDDIQVRIRIRSANKQPARHGGMFFHCGGPGSGRDCVGPNSTGDNVGAGILSLLDDFDIISVDQRGLFDSLPPRAGGDPAKGAFSSVFKTCAGVNLSVPVLEARFKGMQREFAKFYRNPVYQMPSGKNYRDFAGTLNLVHDMDLIRRSMHYDKLSLYGYSYGTQVAAMYATLFPQSTDRVVLTGGMPVSQSVYDFAYGAAGAVTESYSVLLSQCEQQLGCPLGSNATAVFDQLVDDIKTQAIAPPGFVFIGDYFLGSTATNIGLVVDQYQALSDYARLAQRDPAKMEAYLKPTDEWPADGVMCGFDGGHIGDIGGVLGLDLAGHLDAKRFVALIQRAQRDFGYLGAQLASSWASWMVGRETPPPRCLMGSCWVGVEMWHCRPVGGLGNPRIEAVVICALYDPQTYYQWSNQMRDAFPSGMLLTWQGVGHGVFPANTDYAREDAQKCQDKVGEYISTATISDRLRADPICATSKMLDLTQPCSITSDVWPTTTCKAYRAPHN